MQINIDVPYEIRPNIKTYQGTIINQPPDLKYLECKKQELLKFGELLYGQTISSREKQLVKLVSNLLGLPSTDCVRRLAMSLEEDLVIMHNGILEAMCVCFPSGWVPREKLGKSFFEIHSNIADNEKLLSASDSLAKLMARSEKTLFRQVWTVTGNPELSNLPGRPLVNLITDNSKLADLYFRYETQKSLSIGDRATSVFLIKVEVEPLMSVWQQYGAQITNSINSMSESVLHYKNLRQIKKIINNV